MSIIKDTELEHSTGQTEKNTTEPGKMETNMEEDSFTAVRDIKRYDSGQMAIESIGSYKHDVSHTD